MKSMTPTQNRSRRLLRAGLLGAVCLALAACGGGGGSSAAGSPGGGAGGGSGGGGSITPTPTTNGYFLSGPAGVLTNNNAALALTVVNPANAQTSVLVGNVQSENPQNNGTWAPQASVAQFASTGFSATQLGARYRVYANTASNVLSVVDLHLSSPTAAFPAASQLSNLSTSALCGGASGTAPGAPTLINDYATPVNSLLVYRTSGCAAAANDTFVLLSLGTGATTAPLANGTNIEPVDAVHDGTGAITQYLAVVHQTTATLTAGAAQVAVLPNTTPASGPNLGAPTVLGSLINYGNTASGGDFVTLAVVPQANGAVWIWRDGFAICGAFIPSSASASPSAPVLLYTTLDTDIVAGPAYPVGTTAYLAMTDQTNSSIRIIAIDTTTVTGSGTPSVKTVLSDNTAGNGIGIHLIGVAGSNLLYATVNPTTGTFPAIYSVATTATAATGTLVWQQSSATQSVEIDANSSPVLAGTSLYFTVIDSASTGATATQAYRYSGTGTPTSLGSNGSQVIAGAVASPFAWTWPLIPKFDTAIIANFANKAAASYANPSYAGASLTSYDGNANTALLGTLPTPANAALLQSLTVSDGVLQAGMPALFVVGGQTSGSGSENGAYPASDLYLFVPSTAGSLARLTTNVQ